MRFVIMFSRSGKLRSLNIITARHSNNSTDGCFMLVRNLRDADFQIQLVMQQFGAQLSTFENGKAVERQRWGAFGFDAAGAAVASPFRLAGRVFGRQ
ncbi:hypothetical protein K9B32_27205 [Rhizobium sp. 3T7]|uniref:hypothetical protein n=1 Tax=Rhizobium sp. 3T7 TaxID=2874922 RepID=UPI001CCDCCA7|nr:hypothetical protein [Rhizobium sp. 3T7]MBZ9793749.1 hypothetical protein [Rhizobium sp. 3T7]